MTKDPDSSDNPFKKFLILTAFLLALQSLSYADADRPNVIFILADDLGYADLSCFGQKTVPTPNIDALAQQGVKFTNFYAGSAVCAPSRGALMTGMHTGRSPLRGNRWVPDVGVYPLPHGIPLLPEALGRGSNYTTILTGRWHLGGEMSDSRPSDRGFDQSFGKLSSLYPTHSSFFIDPLFRWDGKHIPFEQYQDLRYEPMYENGDYYNLEERFRSEDPINMDMLVTKKAIEAIEKNRGNPYFLYVAYAWVHAPMEMHPDGDFEDENWPFEERAFASMLTALDNQVGRIVDAVERSGQAENTLIIFTSDNGPHEEDDHDADFFDSNGPLRGAKRDLYEGGIRVPLIARWPGTIDPGTTSDHISALWDIYPTVCEAAGAPIPDHVDGISFLPTLKGNADRQKQHPYLYWEFHHNEASARRAARFGRWKAVSYDPTGPVEIYDLATDLGEATDLSGRRPDLVKEAEAIFAGAHTYNPDFTLPNEEDL